MELGKSPLILSPFGPANSEDIQIGEYQLIEINNRWSLVTGSSRGVGLLVVIALAEKVCNLNILIK